MKTPEYYLDEVAKERGYGSYFDFLDFYTLSARVDKSDILNLNNEATLRHSKEACEEQRKICAEEARTGLTPTSIIVDKQSIINAKSPIE